MTDLDSKRYAAGLGVCAIVFLSLATIRIGAPWRLEHEDTGAKAVTFAWAHLHLGLGFTKGQDFQVDARTGEVVPHAHHPPGQNLLLAGAIALFGTHAPALVRGLSLAFHAVTLVLLVEVLRRKYGRTEALLGAAALALVPMSTFFGRMATGFPFALPAIVVFVLSYFEFVENGNKRWIFAMIASGLWGALMEWQFFFAPIACLAHAAASWLFTRRSIYLKSACAVIGLGLGLFLLDLGHIAWAYGPEGLNLLRGGFSSAAPGAAAPDRPMPLLHVTRYFLRYFTEVLCVTGLICLSRWALTILRRQPLTREDQIAMVFFATGLLNMILFPARAVNHHFWSYFFLPFMTIAFVETMRRMAARRLVVAAALILVAGSSAYTLVKRHREVCQYTLIVAQDMKRFLPGP